MSLLTKRARVDGTVSRKKRKLSPPSDATGSASEIEAEEEFTGIAGASDDGGQDDDEEFHGIQDDDEDDADDAPAHTGSGKKGILDGLRDMQDAAELYQSSSFKLQIDALLPNVRPKKSRIAPLERTLHALYALFNQLPSHPAQHPLQASRKLLKKGIAVPYPSPLPGEDTNWKVGFEKPSEVTLVGSWANQVGVKSKDGKGWGVDLAVEMPDELFQEKDYLNYRFFHKRAFFIACIAEALTNKKANLVWDVSYVSLAEDPRLTVLELRLQQKGKDSDPVPGYIRILPTISSTNPIPIHRLSPSSSNIRNISTSTSSSSDPTSSADPSTTTHPATPYYNNALLTHTTPTPFILSTLQLKKTAPAFSDALALLRLWANQRGYATGGAGGLCVHGFGDKGFLWGCILGMLINGEDAVAKGRGGKTRKPLGGGLSSYQLFRGALEFLANHDFDKDATFTKADKELKFPAGDFTNHHQAIFVDSATLVNLIADIPLNSLDLLRSDAKKTLSSLDHQTPGVDPFAESFLHDMRDLPSRFDAVIRADLSTANLASLSPFSTLDHGSPAKAFLSSLNHTLRQGLSNRTKAISIMHPPSSPRALTQAHPTSHRFIHIGLIYDPEHAFRVVDHGPSADEADADPALLEQFKAMWGDKAELRRFADGRITQSVVWDARTLDEKARIPTSVVLFLLQQHFGVRGEMCETWQEGFDRLLRLPGPISKIYNSAAAPAPLGFGGARQAFESLSKAIEGMDDELPLMISSISAVSPYLRSTSPFAPLPMAQPSKLPGSAQFQPLINLVIEFEKSSKWPDDLGAIQKTKLAFLEHIASSLLSSQSAIVKTARVCVGEMGGGRSEVQDQASLEVVTSDGWAFAFRISHDREVTLLDRVINFKPNPALLANGVAQPSPSTTGGGNVTVQAATLAKFTHLQRFVHGPRHHRVVASLNHLYPAFSGTVRLVKRWIASHWMLGAHVGDEAVEIVCASLFVRAGGGNQASGGSGGNAAVPASKERGFALVVKFFANWKWEDGLDVPLYDSDGSSKNMPHEAKPKAGAYTVPMEYKGVWKLSTEFDREGKMWTAQGPDAIVSRRLKAIARATWEGLRGMESGDLDVGTLFHHPTNDYDFVIQLDRSVLPRYAQNISPEEEYLHFRKAGKYANLVKQPDVVARPDFDPARLFFEDIQRTYADTIIFFYDCLGGDRIGGVWDIKLKNPRPFRVLGGFSSVPSTDKMKDKKGIVSLNESAILSELERLGQGLIKAIVKKEDP